MTGRASSWLIEDARESDRDFIRDSWRSSYRHSPGTYDWPDAAYDAWIGVYLDRVLPLCRVTLARPDDWAEGILGWVASVQDARGYRLHWAFTKGPFRRQGICAALISAQDPRGARVYSAKTFHSASKHLASKFGFRFAPVAVGGK